MSDHVFPDVESVPKRKVREESSTEKLEHLQHLFESQADANPDSIAIEGEGVQLTYAELDLQANQLAHLLRAYGAGPGKLIGLYYERSAEPIIAILACLKSGSGYVPIDPVHPNERIAHIIEEANIEILLTEQSLLSKSRDFFSGRTLPTDMLQTEIGMQSEHRPSFDQTGASPSDIAYVIYTSGTTGRPKGVVTEHQHAFRYALAMNEACDTGRNDRVYQGFSLGFDGSIEELWMAFSNGATLIVPARHTAKFGDELAEYLIKHQVTYFSTVPTLLSTINAEIPSLTQIVVSGEVCPPDLIDRWAKPGLSFYNVYGPTEATVNTTSVVCVPGQTVTIGKPLPGYKIYILDEDQKPVKHGEKGELYIGGKTLARGYLNRDDLTATKFLTLEIEGIGRRRVYRTGDLVRWNENEELEFFGRIDGQVKIRGYRVELPEIEAVLLEHKDIRAAVVKLCEKNGFKVLAAYVLAEPGVETIDPNSTLALLKRRLPDYMVPSYMDTLDEFPTLASGKVNRGMLPEPKQALVRSDKQLIEPATKLEVEILETWREILKIHDISTNDDFFKDLGGYSLLAAQMVTQLRDKLEMDVAIRDAYRYPTIQQLGLHLEEARFLKQAPPKEVPTAKEVFESVPKWERTAVKAMQAATIFGFYTVGTIAFSVLVYVINSVFYGNMRLLTAFGILLGVGAISWPLSLAIAIGSKWLLIGRYKKGEFPLWSFYYFRWWLAGRLQAIGGAGTFIGTPMMSWYYRAMGAKVGKGTTIDTTLCSAWDLVSIGDETSISTDSQLLGFRVENGMVRLGTIEIGDRCFLGGHSTLGLNAKMGNDCVLDDQSYLPDDAVMKDGESRRGSPAAIAAVDLPQPEEGQPAWKRPVLWSAIFLTVASLGWLLFLSLGLFMSAALIGAFWAWGVWGGLFYLYASVPIGFTIYCFYLAAIRYVIMPEPRTGDFSVESWAYLQRWFMDGLLRANKPLLKPLYTTLYFPWWLRLMGAKIGKRAEISTVWYCSPELLEIGDESFFADGCIVGGRRTFRGRCRVETNRIGKRSFVGNGANVTTGHHIGDNCLLGVMSAPPTQNPVTDGSEWLGNPAFLLPNRKKVEGFNAAETFKPTKKLYLQRALIDGIRVVLPGYLVTLAFTLELAGLIALYSWLGLWWMVAISPFLTVGVTLLLLFSVVALKWLTLGRFKKEIKPLWCVYIWVNELLNGVYETIYIPMVSMYLGTPLIGPLLRLMGVKVGKNTYINSILFSEFDLIEIGDYVALNTGSVLQTHLFEDRVFKSSYVKLEEGTSVGNMSIVLYDTVMQANSSLASMSLLMKGETLNSGTRWHGIPTVQIH